MTHEQRTKLHPSILAAAEADSAEFKSAAKYLNMVLHPAAVVGRYQGYYRGAFYFTDKYLSVIEKKDKEIERLKGLFGELNLMLTAQSKTDLDLVHMQQLIDKA